METVLWKARVRGLNGGECGRQREQNWRGRPRRQPEILQCNVYEVGIYAEKTTEEVEQARKMFQDTSP